MKAFTCVNYLQRKEDNQEFCNMIGELASDYIIDYMNVNAEAINEMYQNGCVGFVAMLVTDDRFGEALTKAIGYDLDAANISKIRIGATFTRTKSTEVSEEEPIFVADPNIEFFYDEEYVNPDIIPSQRDNPEEIGSIWLVDILRECVHQDTPTPEVSIEIYMVPEEMK